MGGKEEFLKIQTCVLKVNIHCDGCKHKVKKILQKIDGVYTIKIDSEQGKVTVSGNIDPSKIIKKLIKNGKHAELWGASKANPQNFQNQFKNLQIDNGKGGNNNNKGNAQKGKGGGGGGGNNNQPKGGLPPMNPQLQQLQMMKALQDMKMAPKGQQNNQKSVKFDLAEDDGFSDEDFDDDWDDEDDDDYDDDELDEGTLNKMKAMMGNGQGGAQMANILQMQNMMNAKKGGGGGGNIPLQMHHGGNAAGGGKKGGNENNNGGNHNQGGAKGGKNGDHGQDKNGNNSHNFNPNGVKKGGGGMNNGPQGMMMPNMMAAMNKQGNPPMGHMSNLPPVRGMPMAGGGGGAGHFQGDQMPQGGNPFLQQQQQQQLAAMMMNQQRANGNERFQPMMYARPPPAVNYMPPHPSYQYPYPPPPGTRLDDYAMFSDENTSSCSVM